MRRYDDEVFPECKVCGECFPCPCQTNPLSSSCACCEDAISYTITEQIHFEVFVWYLDNLGDLSVPEPSLVPDTLPKPKYVKVEDALIQDNMYDQRSLSELTLDPCKEISLIQPSALYDLFFSCSVGMYPT